MNKFLEALDRLEEAKTQESLFECTFKFFNEISHMDRETVIAAFQAFYIFAGRKKVDLFKGDAKSIRRALVGRMQMLVSQQPDEGKRRALALVFIHSAPNHMISAIDFKRIVVPD